MKEREATQRKIVAAATQKIADTAANNAVIAERIRTKLLTRIEREIDALPEHIGTEMTNNVENLIYDGRRVTKKTYGGKNYRLRDLTAAYRDLTSGMPDEPNNGEPVRIIIDV